MMTDRPQEQSRTPKKTLYRRMRRTLARVVFLRSGYFLLFAIWEALQDTPTRGQAELNQEFASHEDPWNYETTPYQVDRICREVEMLEVASNRSLFENAMEVGCAEGLFTEKLTPLCKSLLAVDISMVALARARRRLGGKPQVQFAHWDFRVNPVPGTYDLIVTIHALEYVRNPLYIRRARAKLVNGLRPGGYLLIGTMKTADIYENSWWGRIFLRSGKRINKFFASHPSLKVIKTEEFHLGDHDVAYDVLLRKVME